MLPVVVCATLALAAAAAPHEGRGLSASIPIKRRAALKSSLRRRQGSQSGAIGLGDIQDSVYSVDVEIGGSTVTNVFDTGSSDLWAITSDCTRSSCGDTSSTAKLSTSNLQNTQLPLQLNYGDSAHPTSASGSIVSGSASVAGLKLDNQFLGAVSSTNTSLSDQNISGIFGIGFPIPFAGSEVFGDVLGNALTQGGSVSASSIQGSQLTDSFVAKLATDGPLMARLASQQMLKQPMFTVTLQREAVEIGGNVGQLTIGQLPDGVSNDSLTWVPVRLYSEDDGGLASPTGSSERYPVRWEIPIDSVSINGQTLPQPDTNGAGFTALVDSGTSFLAGPESSVNSILSALNANGDSSGVTIPCNAPAHLAYVIGGKTFPVDPRDFIGAIQASGNQCELSSIEPTDPPATGALMSWILGDPFMKSNLVAFYYGNLTHPSVDPPRMGFLSTVPSNADSSYSSDIGAAQSNHVVATSIAATSGTFAAASTNSAGVAQATSAPAGSSGSGGKNSATSSVTVSMPIWTVLGAALVTRLFF